MLQAMYMKPSHKACRFNVKSPAFISKCLTESLLEFIARRVRVAYVWRIKVRQRKNVSISVVPKNVHCTPRDFCHNVSFSVHWNKLYQTPTLHGLRY